MGLRGICVIDKEMARQYEFQFLRNKVSSLILSWMSWMEVSRGCRFCWYFLFLGSSWLILTAYFCLSSWSLWILVLMLKDLSMAMKTLRVPMDSSKYLVSWLMLSWPKSNSVVASRLMDLVI